VSSPRTGVVISLLLLAACAGESSGGAPGSNNESPASEGVDISSDAMPAIYVDQRVTRLRSDGTNTERRDYQFTLDICREKGGAVAALSEEEVAKLGVTRLQRWFMAGRAAYRSETFTYSRGAIECQFTLESEGTHAYYDESQSVAIDLATNEKTVSEPLRADLLNRSFGVPLEKALAHEMKTIKTHPVAGPPTKQSVAGAPCLMWQGSNGSGDYCIWSGGTRWGFSIVPSLQNLDSPKDLLLSLVLKQERGPRQHTQITTDRFVVGAGFDVDAMKPRTATTSSSSGEG